MAKFDIAVTTMQNLTASQPDLLKALQAVDLPAPIRPASEPRRALIPIGTKLFDAIHQTAGDPLRQQQGRKAQRADATVYSILYSDPAGI